LEKELKGRRGCRKVKQLSFLERRRKKSLLHVRDRDRLFPPRRQANLQGRASCFLEFI